jgi:hypothetical protein
MEEAKEAKRMKRDEGGREDVVKKEDGKERFGCRRSRRGSLKRRMGMGGR